MDGFKVSFILKLCHLPPRCSAMQAGNIFFEEPPKEDWPPEWSNLILACMASDPDDRPSACAIVLRLSQMAIMLNDPID